jgi:hypothetical protein
MFKNSHLNGLGCILKLACIGCSSKIPLPYNKWLVFLLASCVGDALRIEVFEKIAWEWLKANYLMHKKGEKS